MLTRGAPRTLSVPIAHAAAMDWGQASYAGPETSGGMAVPAGTAMPAATARGPAREQPSGAALAHDFSGRRISPGSTGILVPGTGQVRFLERAR